MTACGIQLLLFFILFRTFCSIELNRLAYTLEEIPPNKKPESQQTIAFSGLVVPIEQISNFFLEDLARLAKLAA